MMLWIIWIFVLFKLFPTKFISAWTRYVLGVPTYFPAGWFSFIKHFIIFLSQKNVEFFHNSKIFGVNAKSLFITALSVIAPQNRKFKILTTPIHHKSFVQIMETHFDSEITILKLNHNFTSIIIDEQVIDLVKECDVIVITHLFGLTFNLDKLISLANKYNKKIIVDSVMSGSHSNPNLNIDVDIYSTGQDKRPVAFGGGYCIVKHFELRQNMIKKMYTYPIQTPTERFKKMLNTMCIRVLYMNHTLQLLILLISKIFRIKLSSVVSEARKTNSGFELPDYLVRPNVDLCESIKQAMPDEYDIEYMYSKSWNYYLSKFSREKLEYFYPYYIYNPQNNIIQSKNHYKETIFEKKVTEVILPYNQIRIPEQLVDTFINFCDDKMICSTKNDNYQCMTNSSDEYHKFMREMVNITTIVGENNHENVDRLFSHLNKWYFTNKF